MDFTVYFINDFFRKTQELLKMEADKIIFFPELKTPIKLDLSI